MNLYVRGKPVVVVVDDRIAFEQDAATLVSSPFFANIGVDGSLWGVLMEKAWAKINGNYERTQAGWQHEALRVMTGAPGYDYLTSTHTSEEIWAILKEADNNGFLMGGGTQGTGDDT